MGKSQNRRLVFVGTEETTVDDFNDIVNKANAHDALVGALKELSNWPRKSKTLEGKLSIDPVIGLANVRRFARSVLMLAGEQEKDLKLIDPDLQKYFKDFKAH
jgi:hypothetical protein